MKRSIHSSLSRVSFSVPQTSVYGGSPSTETRSPATLLLTGLNAEWLTRIGSFSGVFAYKDMFGRAGRLYGSALPAHIPSDICL
ncbi:MAG: hypothetical protein QF678_05675, partial [Candidatus Poseidoniia archaeon]|nr:hypothetical protein [Candidatus Poseidoniia archaeon]